MKKLIYSLAFATSLILISSNYATAQAVTDSTRTAVAGTTTYREHEDHSNWGLLGLVGLIGLAGLGKKGPVVERKVEYRDNQPR